jgi:CRISPR-associated protein Csy1
MENVDTQHVTELRTLIAGFLNKRLDDKLDKLKDEDPKRTELHQQFIPKNWLGDAARRVSQIQAVTHSLKPAHPDAKGTSLYNPPYAQPVLKVVGSHCLGNEFTSDVVGNAAVLDVYKFLKLEHQGRSLLALSISRDTHLAAALSSEPAQAQAWMASFAGLTERRGQATSHTLAKQIYWLVGGDPHDDASFHLIAPLYASSLAHRVYHAVRDDRFSEEAVAARQARKEDKYSARSVREYPQMAIQKLGGTKPQNISQLNSERRGENILFASLPPTWHSIDVRPLLGTDSMFPRFSRRNEVRRMVKALVAFLKSHPASNLDTRRRRDEWFDAITDEFSQFCAELRSLPSGWSLAPECHLSSAEKHWLDAQGIEGTLASAGLPLPTDTAERVSASFANWLNAQLRDPLPMGDPEFLEWRNRMYEQIKAEEREGCHDD